ncbi:MAG: thymidylate synthase [Mycoplasmoidaceae bacterium]
METYLNVAKKILNEGNNKIDRTQVGTKSIFGVQLRFNLQDGFPILTTKKINIKAVIYELLWFLKGDTNIKFLVDNNVNIWNEWPYEKFKLSKSYNNETLSEFINKIKSDQDFADKHGDLGPIYGKQWRNFSGVDQFKNLMDMIKSDPNSRRLIISAWNPAELPLMLLPPCHAFFQFYVSNGKLSCQLYQRSADFFLGVPFNISSYSLLTYMIAHVLNLDVGEYIQTIGDCHIYDNHITQINEQLLRKPYKLPRLLIKRKVNSIFDFKYDDFEIFDYKYHPYIKGKVAV